MQEILLLLIPVSFIVGWFLARRSKNSYRENCSDLNPAYFRGLNLLLNEQPDKAIDVFIQLLDVDSDTVETHLALASLFRRRGEVERAIRIHQNLIARPTLSREQRGEALLQLGLDYMRAGLFDRAESLFEELCELKLHTVPALKNLLIIYQQERDWQKCLSVLTTLENEDKTPRATEKINFYCELAEDSLSRQEIPDASDYLRKAQQIKKNDARTRLMQARIAMMRNDWKTAIKIFKSVQSDRSDLMPLMLDDLVYCYRQAGQAEDIQQQLTHMLETTSDSVVVLKLAELLGDSEGETTAIQFLQQQVVAHPHADVLRRLSQKMRLDNCHADFQPMMLALDKLSQRLSDIESGYQCNSCGYQSRAHHWQCPGCKRWETLAPVKVAEPELHAL